MARVLLVVPTSSYRVADFIEAAEALGVEVAVAAEEDLPLLGVDRFVRIDCSDPVAAAAAGRSGCHHQHRCDRARRRRRRRHRRPGLRVLGLPHNPPDAAAATRDKAAMRLASGARRGSATPIRGREPKARTRCRRPRSSDFPLVVKPLSLVGQPRGDEGRQPEQLDHQSSSGCCGIAGEAGEDGGRLLLEEFVPGPEVAVEGMLWDGVLEILAIFDKPDHPDGPYFEETIYVTPSLLDRAAQDEVARVTQAAITAIGLREGPIHAELRVERRQALR